jgi:hypothetical protein
LPASEVLIGVRPCAQAGTVLFRWPAASLKNNLRLDGDVSQHASLLEGSNLLGPRGNMRAASRASVASASQSRSSAVGFMAQTHAARRRRVNLKALAPHHWPHFKARWFTLAGLCFARPLGMGWRSFRRLRQRPLLLQRPRSKSALPCRLARSTSQSCFCAQYGKLLRAADPIACRRLVQSNNLS